MGRSEKLSWNLDLISAFGDIGVMGVKRTLTSTSLGRETTSKVRDCSGRGNWGRGEFREELDDGFEMGVSSEIPEGRLLPTLISSLPPCAMFLDMERPSPCEALRVGIAGLSRSWGDDSSEKDEGEPS